MHISALERSANFCVGRFVGRFIGRPCRHPISSHYQDEAILQLVCGDSKTPFPAQTIWGENAIVWQSNMADTFKAEVTSAKWDTSYGQATKGLGTPEGSYLKNTTHIADHLAILQQRDRHSKS
jgi:hypothetical protein